MKKNVKHKIYKMIFFGLMILYVGCKENVHMENNVINSSGASSSDVKTESIIVYEDDETKISKIILTDDSYKYVAWINAKSISGKFKIVLDLDSNLEIISVRVPSYIGTHGRKIMQEQFTSQFIGKGPENHLKLGQEVHAITGATASAKTMCESIRKTIDTIRKSRQQNKSDNCLFQGKTDIQFMN